MRNFRLRRLGSPSAETLGRSRSCWCENPVLQHFWFDSRDRASFENPYPLPHRRSRSSCVARLPVLRLRSWRKNLVAASAGIASGRDAVPIERRRIPAILLATASKSVSRRSPCDVARRGTSIALGTSRTGQFTAVINPWVRTYLGDWIQAALWL